MRTKRSRLNWRVWIWLVLAVARNGNAAELNVAHEYAANAATFGLAPWSNGEEMRLDLKFNNGVKIAGASYAVTLIETNGEKVLQLANRIYGSSQSFSQVEVEPETFRPFRSQWRHSLYGEADAIYSTNQVEIVLRDKWKSRKLAIEGAVYDNEELIQLFRRLPLKTGYKTTLRVLSSLSAGGVVPVQVTVTGPEKINVAAGSFDCFKVALSIHQTFWYSADEYRYLVKYDAGGALAELTRVVRSTSEQPEKYQDPELGFSIALPSAWRLWPLASETNGTDSVVGVFDPQMASTTTLAVFKLDAVPKDQRKTIRAWADAKAGELAKAFKGFKVRPDSWKDRLIAGRPGVMVVGDYIEGQTHKVALAAFTFGEMNAAQFVMQFKADEFQKMRSEFDTLLNGYQAK